MNTLHIPYEWLMTITLLMVFLLALNTGFWMRWYGMRRKHMMMLEQTQHTLQHEQALLQSKVELHEHALQHITREIYDNIGQVLSLAKLQVSHLGEKHPEWRLQETNSLLGQAISDLRMVSHCLQPAQIGSLPLNESISHELRVLEKNHAMKTALTVSGAPSEMQAEKKVILFRAFQAVADHSHCHSGAGSFRTHLFFGPDTINLTMEDYQGERKPTHPTGTELTGIAKRIRLIRGIMHIQPIPGEGTRIDMKVPYA